MAVGLKIILGLGIAILGFILILASAIDYLLRWDNIPITIGFIGLLMAVTGIYLIKVKY